jgi:hypothetical protein
MYPQTAKKASVPRSTFRRAQQNPPAGANGSWGISGSSLLTRPFWIQRVVRPFVSEDAALSAVMPRAELAVALLIANDVGKPFPSG